MKKNKFAGLSVKKILLPFFIFFLIHGKLIAQDDSLAITGYEIRSKSFVDYIGFLHPFFPIVPCEGGAFSPNFQTWYFKTQDSILSVEPSYLDSTLLITRTSNNFYEIIKVSLDSVHRKTVPLVLSHGFVLYAVPSNFIRDLFFYVVWNNDKYNVCQYYKNKVDTIFRGSKVIRQFEVISNSTIAFCYDKKLVVYPLNGNPSVYFDAVESEVYGFAADNEGGYFISIDKGILHINTEKQQSLIANNLIKGKLKYAIKELYMLDAENSKLYDIHIPSTFMEISDLKYSTILTNDSVVNMVKQNFTDEQILEKINGSKVDFDLSIDDMIALSKQNVSSDVIIAMEKRSQEFK